MATQRTNLPHKSKLILDKNGKQSLHGKTDINWYLAKLANCPHDIGYMHLILISISHGNGLILLVCHI